MRRPPNRSVALVLGTSAVCILSIPTVSPQAPGGSSAALGATFPTSQPAAPPPPPRPFRRFDLERRFIRAVRAGDTDAVDLALKQGVNVEATDRNGMTALMVAALYHHSDLLILLVARGADLDAQDRRGTALHWAAYGGDPDSVKLLLAAGIKVDVKNAHGETPLHRATESNEEAAIRALIDHGADPNATDENGESPFMWAVQTSRIKAETLEYFLAHGADMHKKNKEGKDAFAILKAIDGKSSHDQYEARLHLLKMYEEKQAASASSDKH